MTVANTSFVFMNLIRSERLFGFGLRTLSVHFPGSISTTKWFKEKGTAGAVVIASFESETDIHGLLKWPLIMYEKVVENQKLRRLLATDFVYGSEV
jgi:hypothetical protein